MISEIENNNHSSPHITLLDGLRGLAILLVASGHIFYRFYVFKFGWIGLNLFFLLSGYLITKRLFFHISSKPADYFKNFYARRILRIFPLYYGCLLFFFLLLPVFYSKYAQIFGSLYNIQLWYWLYISNWRQVYYGLPPNPLFFHFWSLAVEEQFYIIWPVLFLLFQSFKGRLAIISVLLLTSIAIRIWYYGMNNVYYNTFTAGEPLLLGCLVSILEKRNKLNFIYPFVRLLAVISVISLGIILVKNNDLHITNHPLLLFGYLNIDLIWTFLLCFLICQSRSFGIIARFFSSGILVWLGRYSYGIYVFHWIILQLFINRYESWALSHNLGTSASYWLIRILGICLILLVSYSSYHLFEKKFLSLKKYFT